MWASAEQERLDADWQVATAQAWMTAGLSRARRLPSLQSLMKTRTKPLRAEDRDFADHIKHEWENRAPGDPSLPGGVELDDEEVGGT